MSARVLARVTPWQRRFLAFALVFSLGLAAAGAHVSSNYRIALDQQAVRCLPWWSYLVALGVEPARNELVAFESGSSQPMFPPGTLLVKRLIGVPGDRIEVHGGEVRLNGAPIAALSQEVLGSLGRSVHEYDARYQLGEGEYFVLGDAPVSYDSRYWGPVRRIDVVGRARGVL
jgi:conjugal transfer pilin signal peptidase TrbI